MSLSRDVVRALQALGSDIPSAVTGKSRLHLSDSIGISLAAHRATNLVGPLFEATRAGIDSGACRVIGSDLRQTPSMAAFVNSALAHVLDFDDIHDEARLHPTTVTLPAALAAADISLASGDAVLTALQLGNELMCRLGAASAPTGTGAGSDWFLTQLYGYLGATFSAGHVLGLSEDQLVSALGFAYMQAAGGKEAGFGVGSDARAIYPAFAAMGGVTAALLARAGLQGPQTALDGAAGLFTIYLGGEPPRLRDVLLDRRQWWSAAIAIKPWPCCRLSHPYVAAAIDARERLQGAPIERVVIAVNASAAKLCRPLAERRTPRTLQDAKYSIPFMTVLTLARGEPTLQLFDTDVLNDRAVLQLAARTEIDERLPDNPGHPPAEIEITAGGRSFVVRPQRTLDLDDAKIATKFFNCLRFSGAEPSRAQAVWANLKRFDQLAAGQWWESLAT